VRQAPFTVADNILVQHGSIVIPVNLADIGYTVVFQPILAEQTLYCHVSAPLLEIVFNSCF